MKAGELADPIENSTLANFSTLCLIALVGKRCKHHKKIAIFGMSPPLKIITFTLYVQATEFKWGLSKI
jgi:hypothetical protein